jgi:hypothetical protein
MQVSYFSSLKSFQLSSTAIEEEFRKSYKEIRLHLSMVSWGSRILTKQFISYHFFFGTEAK